MSKSPNELDSRLRGNDTKRRAFLLVAIASGAVLAGCALLGPDISPEARRLHFDALIVDTHDDTTQRLLDPAFDFGREHDDGSVDIPRLRAGGMDALYFSVWIPGTVTGAEAVRQAGAQVEAVHRTVARHPQALALARTVAEVEAAHAAGKIAALLGVEGGHMIANDLSTLRRLFERGVRYLTLTHSVNTDWAGSSTDPKNSKKGLNRFGRKVVREMNRLGMVIDVSHVSDQTFYDVLARSKAPVFASHSSVRALCDAPRNMSDRMIRDLAAKGGVIQINYHVGFLSQAFRDAANANDKQISKEIDAAVEQRCGKDRIVCQILENARLTREYMEQGRLPRVEWTAIVEHIDHVVKLVGAAHVGLGSDFDGAVMPFGMEDASMLPKITGALLGKGYSEADIRNILGGNTLRVMREVEAAAARSQGSRT